ncbi:putative transcriptional regulator with C-terminal CBS domains [Thioflavicoccus mobilis 8321]|uniref:Putative transcriptional regulator with C-terminal CBS domains n=1 Tax=Thioflavicoccus mobilis 8321 TaxID=765912 RepID=L0GYH7_9GAMM|nr:helix-turn-helix transcriptional regulator [Thioflavicoccus mobilis]AGA91828.1 putative transcriptional regulator with C-terminal CBS domains [Thioflavicoccus mobilis 8321]
MQTHDELIETLIQRPGVQAEVERLEREEFGLLDLLLKARHEAGLSQAQVAERMGTHAPAVARLERALATGKHSPSVATLRKYARACGKNLFVDLRD